MVCFCVTLQIHFLLAKNMYFNSILFLELMFKMYHVSKYNQNWYFWPLRLKSISSQADLPIYAHWQTPCAPLWLSDTSNWKSLWKPNYSHAQRYRRIFTQVCAMLFPISTLSRMCFGVLSPGNAHLKAEVSKGLCCSNSISELHLRDYLFSASWTWATGEYVTIREMRFLAKGVRCRYGYLQSVISIQEVLLILLRLRPGCYSPAFRV